jgi:hypothetical protein
MPARGSSSSSAHDPATMIGTQEIIAIIIVIAIVCFALWRRLHKKTGSTKACSNCDHGEKNTDEQPVRFFKKQP